MERLDILEYANRWLEGAKRLKTLIEERQEEFKYISTDNKWSSEISTIVEKLSFLTKKLEKDIMEIAFVGLEKSGKSTLVNAVIGSDLLPSAERRTTYTTTQIEYSEENKMIISFYREDEFNKEVFQKMLADIEYPNYEFQTIDTVSMESFVNYFESLKDRKKQIYEKYKGNLEEDIKDIVEGRAVIKQYLRGNVLETKFSDISEYKDFIVDRYKSRAVKEVRIYTNALKGLENVIIYDLPGFDSPTFIHSSYTKDKIRKADAVVFTRIAERPSITGPELNIINSTREEDGVVLREKIFFFCNMADKLENIEALNRVKKDFNLELQRGLGFNEKDFNERVVYGSAKSRLRPEEYQIKLERLGLNDGIDELLEKLRTYNRTKRREVIYKRINTLIDNLQRILEEIFNKIEEHISDTGPINYNFITELDKIKVKVREKILIKLDEFQINLKSIQKEKPISNMLKQEINSKLDINALFSKDEQELIIKRVEAQSSTPEKRPDEFNRQYRLELQRKVIEIFFGLLKDKISIQLDNINHRLTDIFVNSLIEGDDLQKKEELRKEVEEFLKNLDAFLTYQKLELGEMVQRFGTDLIELLVQNPASSQDRKNKLEEIKSDIYSLIAYHPNFDESQAIEEMEITQRILYSEKMYYDMELEKLLIKIEELIGGLTFSQKGKLLQQLITIQSPIELIERIINNKYMREFEDIVKFIERNATNRRKVDDYELVIKEIAYDLNLLKEMLENAVINAIAPEKAILSRITNKIKQLRDVIERGIELNNFINRIVHLELIAQTEMAEAIRKMTIAEKLRRLRDELRVIFVGLY